MLKLLLLLLLIGMLFLYLLQLSHRMLKLLCKKKE